MKQALLATLFLAAAPPAFAQGTGQGAGTAQGPLPTREPNLANPQAQDNMQTQAPNAQPSAGNSDASSIPTPTLTQSMTPTKQ